ncbi:hypothetical protein CVT26_015593 [Gymnopilus dilepis]|uniref:Uncharacterized protein n=1 Tax=Gymnopilus dilepis TaxID=231916 RepID=A0A409XYQ2_9AGAR|nr:hypothetical protein CVT26_015593 [Gymnopilus dilepis]
MVVFGSIQLEGLRKKIQNKVELDSLQERRGLGSTGTSSRALAMKAGMQKRQDDSVKRCEM